MPFRDVQARRHKVCREEELRTGEVRSVRVDGRRLVVACTREGSYRAFSDTCPHELARLSLGKVEKMLISDRVGKVHQSGERYVIVCPWHNFEFDLESGFSVCEPERLRIKTYRAEAQDGEVVVYV